MPLMLTHKSMPRNHNRRKYAVEAMKKRRERGGVQSLPPRRPRSLRFYVVYSASPGNKNRFTTLLITSGCVNCGIWPQASISARLRSEERRVGKEGRVRWGVVGDKE